jgi:capsular polysaccharide export protein
MRERLLPRFAGKRVLLLQGPVGPFFARLAADLQTVAAAIFKVNFNGGDWLFFPQGSIQYRGSMAEWPAEFERLVRELRIDAVILFGDCRPIHLPVNTSAERLGIEVWAFEEGYVRPNFVTFEAHGVNNRSRLPRDAEFYREAELPVLPPEREVGYAFRHVILWAALYYAAAFVLALVFRGYQHHRPLSVLEAIPWLISPLRKAKYRWLERGVERQLSGLMSKRYFLVALQVHIDAQVLVHSDFKSIPEFIEKVVASFAAHASASDYLVIKHHPLDRGYHDYTMLLKRLQRKYGVGGRVLYIHDQHLPTLLANTRGVVVINSTVGLSALHHGAPVVTMGESLYDIEGLTAHCTLDEFWKAPERWTPDRRLYQAFLAHLIQRTQLNGNFYRGGLFALAPARSAREFQETPRDADADGRPDPATAT